MNDEEQLMNLGTTAARLTDNATMRTRPVRMLPVVLCLSMIAAACGVPGLGSADPEPTTTSVSNGDALGSTAAVSSEPAESSADVESNADLAPDSESAATVAATGVVATGGAVDEAKGVEYTVGTTTASGDGLLVVELDVESVRPVDFRLENLTLLDAAGQPVISGEIVDHVGEPLRSLDFAGRGFRSVTVQFEVDEPPVDAGDWAIRVGHEDEIPLLLPLEGAAFASSYPLPLPHGEAGAAFSGTFGGCSGEGIEMSTLIDAATVTVDRGDERGVRARDGERFVQIQLALTNDDDDQANCKELVLWPDFDLDVDGISVKSARYDVSPVEAGATVVLDLDFPIPSSAERLELVGGADRRILASWNVDLPDATGEAGTTLTREALAVSSPPAPAVDFQPSPADLVSVERGSGGASGTVLGARFVIGTSTVTNAGLDSLAPGDDPTRDELGRTWITSDLTIEASIDAAWLLELDEVVLESPDGRSFAAAVRFDGDEPNDGSIRFEPVTGPDPVRFVFETPGLVSDLAGWTVVIEPRSLRSLRLPVDGASPDQWPIALTASASRNFSVGSYGGCTSTDGDEINATIAAAEIDVERRNSFDDLRRSEPGSRFIRVDLELTNLVPAPQVFSSTTANCGAVVLFPPFLIRADGRFLQRARSVDSINIDYGATENLTVVIEIPDETQSVDLYAGTEPTLIAGWQLKDNQEVLTDFEAKDQGEQTLVTLDERVLFAFGSAELSDDAIAPLTRLANVLLEDSFGDVVITGHTDAIGTDASNERLSTDRAEAVVEFLVEAGVDADRLVAIGAGETAPVAPNENEDGSDNPIGRAMNRRVEVLFSVEK